MINVPMNLYLDCEFNGFGGELISMALVPEDSGEPWYEVIPCTSPTPWVSQHVIPVLGKPPLPDQRALTTSLARYLHRYKAACIVADWPEDFVYFCQALILEPGNRIDTPSFTMAFRPDLSADESACRNNALEDAKALRRSALRALHPRVR